MIYALLGLATEDIEGLPVGKQLRVDEIVHRSGRVLHLSGYVLGYRSHFKKYLQDEYEMERQKFKINLNLPYRDSQEDKISSTC